jgi:hypothetical protein
MLLLCYVNYMIIWWTGSIITRTVVSVEVAVQQWQSMYLHVSRYSHDVSEAPRLCYYYLHNIFQPSSKGYYSVIEIKWFLEDTWCITTETWVSVEAAEQRRYKQWWSTHPHASVHSHDFFWTPLCILINYFSATQCTITGTVVQWQKCCCNGDVMAAAEQTTAAEWQCQRWWSRICSYLSICIHVTCIEPPIDVAVCLLHALFTSFSHMYPR